MPKLGTGVLRAVAFASLAWAAIYFMINREAFAFSWTVATSTPSTMCSDVYAPGDKRLVDCESAGPTPWTDRYLAKARGEPIEVPFDYYQRERHQPIIWLWLFGVPLALFAAAFGVAWIRNGFARDRAEMR
jgi:hypothetical protein